MVFGGSNIARSFGVPEAIIGADFFAFGTSLPGLATSVVAAIRKHGDIIVGNAVGSAFSTSSQFWGDRGGGTPPRRRGDHGSHGGLGGCDGDPNANDVASDETRPLGRIDPRCRVFWIHRLARVWIGVERKRLLR